MLDAPTRSYPAGHVRHIVMKNICELGFGAVTLLSMKVSGKKFKRKRDPGHQSLEEIERYHVTQSASCSPTAQ
jgi:hypothetical protein